MTAALAERLLARLPAGTPGTERDQISRAYDFAARCHEGQWRKSGDPYITHPVAVAEIAIDSGLDCPTVCAALLHDVIEDTACDAARLRAELGVEIAGLVEMMTDLDSGQASIADDRVLALKVLDRLHNMRTLQYLDQDKQRLKSQHTLDLMAPLARRLGLRKICDELESIARTRLAVRPADAAGTYQALALGSLLLPPAARARYLDEWLGELDVLPDRPARTRFVLRLTFGMPMLALALRRQTRDRLTGRLLDALRWILRRDLRTWTPLTILVGWMIVETARTGLGDAAVTLITVPPVLHAGVTRLRARLGLHDPP